MNIGDRVRLLHSKEEGIITRFLKENVVEVEIEAGFKLPVLKRELAVVSKTENQFFKASQPISEPKIKETKPAIRADKGVFLAFVPVDDKTVSIYIINNTDWDLPFSLTLGTDRIHTGLLGGLVKGKSVQKSFLTLALKDIDTWGSFTFQALYFISGPFDERNALMKKLRIRANTWPEHKKTAPLLEKEAFLYQLDSDDAEPALPKKPEPEKIMQIDAAKLREGMLEKKEEKTLPNSYTKPAAMVDLHIEALTKNAASLNNAQMLELQMSTFLSKFEQAIASGMDEITFIHGVGNGVLRQEIQRKLSGHKNVAWFEDAQKEKFGYGATRIRIK